MLALMLPMVNCFRCVCRNILSSPLKHLIFLFIFLALIKDARKVKLTVVMTSALIDHLFVTA